MRTTITVGQLAPAQLDWLHGALRDSYAIEPGALRMCVVFEGPNGEPVRHVEMPAGEWVIVMNRLHRLTRVAEAALTPDAAPDISWGTLHRERCEAELKGWSGL